MQMARYQKKVFEKYLMNMHYILCNRMVTKMKYWQIVCAILFLISILISRKVNVFKIIIEQFKIYKNDRNGKYYWLDLITFLLIPVFIGAVVALNLPISKITGNADSIITVFSLIATLPLSFLALLIDRILKTKKEEEVAKETFVSITIGIIYTMVIIGVIVFATLTPLPTIVGKILVGTIATLTVKMVLNILMILKRVFNSY